MENIDRLKEYLDKEKININNLKDYDFSNDDANENYRNINNSIKKYYIYKIAASSNSYKSNINKEYYQDVYVEDIGNNLMKTGNSFIKECIENYYCNDPDSNSNMLQIIYRILWEDKYLNYLICKNKVKGETINSVSTTLNELYQKFEDENIYLLENKKQIEERKKLKFEENSDEQKPSVRYQISRFAVIQNNEKEIKKLNDIYNNELKDVKKLFEMYHTLGNFIPFPLNIYAFKDYFDLKLKMIYEYYIDGKEDMLKDFCNNDIEKINKCKKYFDLYKKDDNGNVLDNNSAWSNFVIKNYLQDFVVEIIKDKEYKNPYQIFENHFNKKDFMPEDYKECLEYFENANKLIILRGKRMQDELIKRINGNKKGK